MDARSPAERRARFRLWLSLGLALLIHLIAGLIWTLVEHEGLAAARMRAAAQAPMSLRPLSNEQWAKNRGPEANRPPPPRRAETKPPEVRPQGQVVDVAPGNREEAPDARYLAESANRAQKETRAKETTPFYRNAMPQRTSPTPHAGGGQDEAARVSGNEGVGSDNRPRQSQGKQGALEIPSTRKQQELAMRLDRKRQGEGPSVSNRQESEAMRGNSSRLNLKPGEVGAPGKESSPGRVGPRGPINLSPSASVLDRIAGAAPNDHLQDVDEGEGTFLNTREWKYASFFNRVKQSVGMHWDPGTQLRQRDPSGEIYGGRDRYTVLHVTLDARGSLRDVEVEKSSGVAFLDQEAIASFRRAQPFPNPPPGLVAPDSTVKFSFGFFLELGSGPRMRLFRGP